MIPNLSSNKNAFLWVWLRPLSVQGVPITSDLFKKLRRVTQIKNVHPYMVIYKGEHAPPPLGSATDAILNLRIMFVQLCHKGQNWSWWRNYACGIAYFSLTLWAKGCFVHVKKKQFWNFKDIFGTPLYSSGCDAWYKPIRSRFSKDYFSKTCTIGACLGLALSLYKFMTKEGSLTTYNTGRVMIT